MLDVSGIGVFEREQLGPPMVDREHDDRERAFQSGMLVKIVNDNFWIRVQLQLDDNARVLVRLVADGGDVRENFFVHQLGDPFHQRGPVHVVGNFGDDDLFLAALDLLHAGLAADFHAAPAAFEVLFDAGNTADGATGWKIRPFYKLHQFRDGDIRIVDLGADAIDHFAQIVRRNVRGHAHGDAGSTVDQKIRKGGWKDGGLG